MELLSPPSSAVPGERITVEGFPGEPDTQLNPKKKVWESIQPELKTSQTLVASYKGVALTTKDGPCTVASLGDASIG